MVSLPIAKRVARLRLSKAELARKTSLHENTIGRALASDPRTLGSTDRRVADAVLAEELELLNYLLDLHPPVITAVELA